MIFKAEVMDNSNKIPEIKRSRGYLLYDTKGKRYLDFYQDSGRAVLGHRVEGISRVIKSTVARGLTASYPSVYTKRIEKELKLLFPGVLEFRIYNNMERCLSFISAQAEKEISLNSFADFSSKKSTFGLWRPFLGSRIHYRNFDFFIPVLPFPGNFGPVVLAVNKADNILEPSDDLSPLICDTLIKSIATLINYIKIDNCIDRSVFESPIWERFGPYLRFKLKGEEYSELFTKALKCSVLLPPEPDIPGIIPCYYEKGQIKDFMDMIRSDYGN